MQAMGSSGCQVGDFECLCRSELFINTVASCVTTACTPDDIQSKPNLFSYSSFLLTICPIAVLSFSKDICAGFGIDITKTLPGGQQKREQPDEAAPVAEEATSVAAVIIESVSASDSAVTASGKSMTTECSTVPVVVVVPTTAPASTSTPATTPSPVVVSTSAVMSQPVIYTGAANAFDVAPAAMAVLLAGMLI
jgi:hypothetical protein